MPHIETSRHCSAYDYCFLFQSQMIQFASKKCKPRMVWTFRMVEECSCLPKNLIKNINIKIDKFLKSSLKHKDSSFGQLRSRGLSL